MYQIEQEGASTKEGGAEIEMRISLARWLRGGVSRLARGGYFGPPRARQGQPRRLRLCARDRDIRDRENFTGWTAGLSAVRGKTPDR